MCIFCDIIAHKIPSSVVYEDENTLAILDISQVTKGHTIVMPKKHCANVLEADEETVRNTFAAAAKVAGILNDKLHPQGLNLLNNCGEAAGQTVEHLHVHIIPRYGAKDALSIVFSLSKEEKNLDAVLKEIQG